MDTKASRGEDLALYAQLLKPPGIIVGQQGNLAGPVVHHAHFHALRRLPGQDLQDSSPHEPLVHNEKFKEDVLLRPFELFQQDGEHIVPQGEICELRALVYRVAAGAPQISGKACGLGFFPLEVSQDLLVLAELFPRVAAKPDKAVPQQPVANVAPGIEQKQGPRTPASA